MLTIFLTIAAAYFFAQGAIGCYFFYGLLQLKREQGKMSDLVMTILTWLIYGLTLGGIFALAMLYREYKADATEEMKVIFAITLFVMIGLLFVSLKEWNRLLQKLK
ncbi:hypothetical protein C8R32_1235 [Nitrosospira sp. Nsp5]|uniref:Uncharacterized protein n=1 Tax=Nitrosospira multiformis TaxID=1231 RepID=A0ABY0TDR6_9PROT|nr:MULTISPECIES: hypothetical protein [Nitrosospira]PTR05341.1 hypothetical protein C8R32_1235 [Nitrosospira sp. Nsp5]SDQ66824.1 hypothetical protein SAMN05216402_1773 [Nitrosospira multiformis]